MRVGLVCYGLNRPLSGTTRVAYELGKALAAHQADTCDVVYLTPYARGPFRDGASATWRLRGCGLLPGMMLFGGPLIAVAARLLRLDVVHDPVGVSPFTLGRWAGRFRRMVHVHDAIAFRFPQGYPRLNTFLHRRFVPATLPNVDAVLTVSRHAAEDVRHYLGWPQDRTFVVPNGVSDIFRPIPPSDAKAVAARYGLHDPYVLSVGTPQPRKNFGRLIEAFGHVRRRFPTYHLALVGSAPWTGRGFAASERVEPSEAVTLLGSVPDADLPALYGGAAAVVVPSLYEGFGLPPLEAMACGTPVVCSNATSLPEVVGDAALLVDPERVDAIAAGLERVLSDTALRQRLTAAGYARAAAFTWPRAAAATAAAYRAALDR